MRLVFADTAYWIALTNVQDSARSYSVLLRPGTMVTTVDVVTEYLNYFAGWGPGFRRKAAGNVEAMMNSRTMRVLPQTNETFVAALALYRARLDKGYSLTDCVSMYTMRREGLVEVLTSDRHFEQEGFRALLRTS